MRQQIKNNRYARTSKIMAHRLLYLVLLAGSQALAQNYPYCQGIGGIKSCTIKGRFQCQNGRISKSKRTCEISWIKYLPEKEIKKNTKKIEKHQSSIRG